MFGGVYFAVAASRTLVRLRDGVQVSSLISVFALIGIFGAVLLYGGYRLPDADIDAEFHPYVAGWCLAGFGVMIGILALFQVLADDGIANPDRVIPILTAFSTAAGFGVGLHDARARSRAHEVEMRNRELRHVQQQLEETVDQLQISRRRYRALAEYFPNGLVTLFDDDLTFTLAAGQAFDELPVDPDDVQGEAPHDVFGEAVTRDLEPALQAALEGDENSVELEYAGREWIFYAVPVSDEDDTVSAGMTMAQDITARKEIQRELEKSERRYRTLAENFPNGAVGVYDRDLRYTLTAGRVLGDRLPDANSLQGDRMPDIFPDEAAAELEPLFRAAIEDGETGSTTTEFDGRIWRVWAAPLRDDVGEIFAGLSFTQDVTDQVEQKQKLEASNERLEQFAYAASHDLQEPLRMVSSYLQLLERRYADALDDDGREFVDYAVDGAERMRAMIDGLLEYSRVESQSEPFESVELNDILDDVLDDLHVQIDEYDAEVTADTLPRVEGDANQLRQVLQNLLENAITYSGDEPPRVSVAAERRGRQWTITVRDDGIGITQDEQDRIFTVFNRLHTHDEYEGTGIGLALCRRIVDRHGGDIWVESSPGEGSTFFFTLPAGLDGE